MSSINEQLIQAIIDNNVSEVTSLLARGADPNYQEARSQGFSCLHFAAQNQNEDIVQLLLHAGASVASEDRYGNIALWTATFNSRGEGSTIKALLAHGAKPDHKNKAGKSPRELAETIANNDIKQFFE